MKTCVRCEKEQQDDQFKIKSSRCHSCLKEIREITYASVEILRGKPNRTLLTKRVAADRVIDRLLAAGYTKESIEKKYHTSFSSWSRSGVPKKMVPEVIDLLKGTIVASDIRPDSKEKEKARISRGSNRPLSRMLIAMGLSQRELRARLEERLRIKLAPNSVYVWLNSKVPEGIVRPLCEISNGLVTPHALRPDLYDERNDLLTKMEKFPWLKEFISRLGGYREAAKILRLNYNTLYSFNKGKSIPLRYIDILEPYVQEDMMPEFERLKDIAEIKALYYNTHPTKE